MISPSAIIASFVGCGGFYLLYKGFPRRVEDVRRCSRCGYNMEHAPGPVCPECGRDSSIYPLSTGKLKIGGTALFVGTALLAFAAIIPWAASQLTLTWRHVEPVSWLLRDVARPSIPTRLAAQAELWRRQGLGRLTPTQVDAFLASFSHIDCQVRPVCSTASTVPVLFSFITPLPPVDDLEADYSILSMSIDGAAVPNSGRGPLMSTFSAPTMEWTPVFKGWGSTTFQIPPVAPGDHTLIIQTAVAVAQTSNRRKLSSTATPRHVDTQTLHFRAGAPQSDPITLISRPDLNGAILSAISMVPPFGTPTGAYPPGVTELEINARNPPIDFAFDVFVAFQGSKTKVGTIAGRAGNECTYCLTKNVPEGHGNKIDVILEPSAEVARATADVHAIWGKPVVFHDQAVDP